MSAAEGKLRQELPTHYYHAHFCEMLDFVGRHYRHVLDAGEAQFRAEFDRLGFDAQCLYARLVNRKGRVFAASKLRYPELGDTGPLLETLEREGFVELPDDAALEDLLAFMTRGQLVAALRKGFAGLSPRMKKAELVEFARRRVSVAELLAVLPPRTIVCQGRSDTVRFLTFLYFGRVQDGLSQFTMRDLGLVRTRHVSDDYEPRFVERSDALASFYYANRHYELKRRPELARALADELDRWPAVEDGRAARRREAFASRLGRLLEADGDTFAALRVYERGESARCSERVIRLLLKSGQREEARRWLEERLERPASDEEALLAADLYQRKFGRKRTSSLTDLLRAAETIDLDEALSGAPERAAVGYFRARGIEAHRVENSLWRTLFGLLFWDLLFDGDAATAHSPFDQLPASLVERRFATGHAEAIDKRLALLDSPRALKTQLLKTAVARFGTHNSLFRWRQRTLDAMYRLVECAPPAAMADVLRRFCENYPDARYGYPDLMLIDEDGVRFVEIKTEGDQLRRNQLLRIEQLRAAGFRADIVRVRWMLDPAQVYVVVDVETTGGRGEQHRVTEIGAVKLRGGRVIDRFETLLNPQRSIPPNITRLTGITPAMVADAPVFADVADDLARFLDGAIFVAHNVEFDYRFIGQEFRRIGRRFRMPKLCTCASMRRLYPGHCSYSLSSLCENYGIPLKSHHRALCDAEAAAELLMLINDRRAEQLAAVSPVD